MLGISRHLLAAYFAGYLALTAKNCFVLNKETKWTLESIDPVKASTSKLVFQGLAMEQYLPYLRVHNALIKCKKNDPLFAALLLTRQAKLIVQQKISICWLLDHRGGVFPAGPRSFWSHRMRTKTNWSMNSGSLQTRAGTGSTLPGLGRYRARVSQSCLQARRSLKVLMI